MLDIVQRQPSQTSPGNQEEHDMNHHDDGSTPANETDRFATLGKRRRGVRVTYAAAVALGLAVGGGAIAGAATGSSSSTTPPASHADGPGGHMGFGGTPPTAFGTVASVGTNTFTLTTHEGAKVTVNVSGTTTYVDSAVPTPSIADVKVGDHVAVFGTDVSNTVAATKVATAGAGGPGGGGGNGDSDGPGGHMGPGGTPPAAVGTVASVGTNIFTLTTPDGTKVTVDVGSSTSFMEFGKTSASIADVTVGAHVAVFGTDTNNTVTATKVGIGGPGGSGGPGGTRGPDGAGGWAPSWSRGTSSSGSSSSSTTSSGSSSGSTLA
jgi:hypothetical protein